MVDLVFVHGRNQQGRDPDQLRRRWAAGLNKGLTAAELPVLDADAVAAIRFPFYGDVLYTAIVQGRAAVPDVASLDAIGWVDPGLPPQVNLQQVAMLRDMATELGFDSTVVPEETLAPVRAMDAALAAATEEERLVGVPGGPWFRALLQWVANNSGVDEAVIRGYLRDVSAYLELPGCREAVQNVVRPALLPDDPGVPSEPGDPGFVVPQPGVILNGNGFNVPAASAHPTRRTRFARAWACSSLLARHWASMRSPRGCGHLDRRVRSRPG